MAMSWMKEKRLFSTKKKGGVDCLKRRDAIFSLLCQ
jgi:hypothetical protein